jgi:hypothetical protein
MFYMTAEPNDLRAEYWSVRRSLYNTTELARHVSAPKGRRSLAGSTGRLLREFDLITNIARKRGIDLLATVETPENEHADHEGWHCYPDSAACYQV